MYDHEKSDPAIVAVKPTNKAGQPAAELVEPRAGAEGNVSQQSTGRAQYRGTVSQALARIRQAARQRKKEKFTALFHHVSIAHLAEAFSELKENAAAGVDGLTCRDRVPIPRHQSLAAHATAAEPERLDDPGADQAVGRRLAPETANPSSVARESLRR